LSRLDSRYGQYQNLNCKVHVIEQVPQSHRNDE